MQLTAIALSAEALERNKMKPKPRHLPVLLSLTTLQRAILPKTIQILIYKFVVASHKCISYTVECSLSISFRRHKGHWYMDMEE